MRKKVYSRNAGISLFAYLAKKIPYTIERMKHRIERMSLTTKFIINRRMTKKILFLWILLLPVAVTSFAQSGKTGPLTWTFSGATLTISGTGAIPDYSDRKAPWYSYCSSIATVIIENNVTSIGNYAFSYCSNLTSIIIGDGVTNIGERVFYNCYKLTSIIIGNGVTSIGERAFYNCYKLTSIIIASGVTRIGDSAFFGCVSLTSVTNLNPTPQNIMYGVFVTVNLRKATLYVPAESVDAYKLADVWKEFGAIRKK
jgi:hypothetical protein